MNANHAYGNVDFRVKEMPTHTHEEQKKNNVNMKQSYSFEYVIYYRLSVDNLCENRAHNGNIIILNRRSVIVLHFFSSRLSLFLFFHFFLLSSHFPT